MDTTMSHQEFESQRREYDRLQEQRRIGARGWAILLRLGLRTTPRAEGSGTIVTPAARR